MAQENFGKAAILENSIWTMKDLKKEIKSFEWANPGEIIKCRGKELPDIKNRIADAVEKMIKLGIINSANDLSIEWSNDLSIEPDYPEVWNVKYSVDLTKSTIWIDEIRNFIDLEDTLSQS